MPLINSIDKFGRYYRWGKTKKKWYYRTEEERKRAKFNAIIQGYAIEKAIERRKYK